MESNGQYYPLWESNRARIIKAIVSGGGILSLSESDFILRGNRDSYTFRIEYKDGQPVRRGGSAVARDLQDKLEQYKFFSEVMKGRDVIIRMTSSFEVIISVSRDDNPEIEAAVVGMKISHKSYGLGTIEYIDEEYVVVRFGAEVRKMDYKLSLITGIIEIEK